MPPGGPCNRHDECGQDLCIARVCVPAPVCGNARLEPGEECDAGDQNGVDGNICGIHCRLQNGQQCIEHLQCESLRCDQGICQPCTSDDQCASNQCVDGSCVDICGNGTVDAGEECDEGPLNSDVIPDRCRTDCRNPMCGDGIPDGTEQCDDGNRVSGDGCDRLCRIEIRTTSIDLPGTSTANVINTQHPPAGQTGPGAIAVMAAGGAAGWAWVRRRRKTM